MSYPSALEKFAGNETEGSYAPSRLFGYNLATVDPGFTAANPPGLVPADIQDRWNFYVAGTDNGIVHAAPLFLAIGVLSTLLVMHFTK